MGAFQALGVDSISAQSTSLIVYRIAHAPSKRRGWVRLPVGLTRAAKHTLRLLYILNMFLFARQKNTFVVFCLFDVVFGY